MIASFLSMRVDHKEFHDHWSNSDVVPGSLSLKCTLHLMRRVHEWVDVFLCIAQSQRLEQIRVVAEISDREVLQSNVILIVYIVGTFNLHIKHLVTH